MTIAWVLFAFVGLFTARYMRQVWEPTELFGVKAWFAVHRTLMTLTVLLTVTGIIVIFVQVNGWSVGAGPHPYLGIIVLVLALAQPIMAAFRPHPGEPRRNIFNWAHRIVGTTALILGVVTIYFGLDIFDLGSGMDKSGLYAVISFYIGEFIVFLFEVYLIISNGIARRGLFQ
ncbi:DOMON domain-containing protein frrs1L [Desmophyllum pertusum]|uniref:DOMON domain-containing protein frrs1L n=1 Tax=Desmophyllum pertusum TaxID=174260 RepID=A0A9X0D5F7_9CNID|nr:DOMON domain-containing protein frrs1L [Desmophyllum pertusum]